MTKSKSINNGRPNTAQKTKRFSNMIPTKNLGVWKGEQFLLH